MQDILISNTDKLKEFKEALKEASAANVPSQPQNPSAPSTDEELIRLRFATRHGDDKALAERLLHTEHILAKDAQQVAA